ncbi:putative cinnamoyl-CoA reductase [Tripterygium wilfordii]|uniref:Putative cinnamoyl-CoA reductase n=1 Tax=Tripterygium wilfordii TaxID=458696 RepID=A0A7J7D057_TRIWF|nr:cinnamoyl-CoA reductase-like SNL6 [Tripterygium wilfordii]KAF5739619.1 putative cinnamoyl-CoA reductase [Tripterygium wilfordii]
MRIVRPEEIMGTDLEDHHRALQAFAGGGVHWRKDEEELKDWRVSSKVVNDCEEEKKIVCVTSGVSYLGLAIVNKLICHGYSVRTLVDNQEDIEKLREMEISGEIRPNNNMVEPVIGNLTEVESLLRAFEGCCGVFHTSAFADSAGVSGYTKSIADIEAKVCENVMKASARTPSVKKCVLTSSLLACLWRDGSRQNLSPVVDHECWSDESVCLNKKLWLALGKLKAERAAWSIAMEEGLSLVSICPGLITGPKFFHENSTASIAYLKGAREMFSDGLLATVDVNRLAEAHLCVFEATNRRAVGRFICYDQVIDEEEEAEKLAKQMGLPVNRICGSEFGNTPLRFHLSNRKLSNLMSRTLKPCHNES